MPRGFVAAAGFLGRRDRQQGSTRKNTGLKQEQLPLTSSLCPPFCIYATASGVVLLQASSPILVVLCVVQIIGLALPQQLAPQVDLVEFHKYRGHHFRISS